MSANRIFLVCTHCPRLEDALCIAERPEGGAQYSASSVKRADDWFATHMRCAPTMDHFQLAFHRPQNWDVSPPAPAVASGVRLALLNGSNGSGGES